MKEAVLKLLLDVRSLIEKGWAKGHAARDKSGKSVNWSCDTATNFCLLGAMFRVSNNHDEPIHAVYLMAKKTIEQHLDQRCLATWNDSRTDKRQVLRMLDAVIAEVSK
jgi:hypothetical protein